MWSFLPGVLPDWQKLPKVPALTEIRKAGYAMSLAAKFHLPEVPPFMKMLFM
jgi:hypothetical protein